jgi:hypothetical protein
MLKRKFEIKTYNEMGSPDLGCKVYFKKNGKKVWGKVALLSFNGFKDAKKGLVLLGLQPFNNAKIKAK